MARGRRGASDGAPRTSRPRRRRSDPGRYAKRLESFARKLEPPKLVAELTAEERARARGHVNEAAEKRDRRRRIRQKFGVTPETLAKLRRVAQAHMIAEYEAAGTKTPPNARTIRDNLRKVGAEGLARILTMTGDEMRQASGYEPATIVVTYPELLDLDADIEDLEDGEEAVNPFWYH